MPPPPVPHATHPSPQVVQGSHRQVMMQPHVDPTLNPRGASPAVGVTSPPPVQQQSLAVGNVQHSGATTPMPVATVAALTLSLIHI
eukprot:3980602-Alexandrium_andersonii.AAC.1